MDTAMSTVIGRDFLMEAERAFRTIAEVVPDWKPCRRRFMEDCYRRIVTNRFDQYLTTCDSTVHTMMFRWQELEDSGGSAQAAKLAHRRSLDAADILNATPAFDYHQQICSTGTDIKLVFLLRTRTNKRSRIFDGVPRNRSRTKFAGTPAT